MDLTRIILGEVTTEKTERMKTQAKRVYTLRVHDHATKIDVKAALKKFYDVDTTDIRIMKVGPKTRAFGRNQTMQKRSRFKKALVTLAPKTKSLDLTTFKA